MPPVTVVANTSDDLSGKTLLKADVPLEAGKSLVGAGGGAVVPSGLTAPVVKSAAGVQSAATPGTDYANLAFKTVAVAGQGDVVAETAADTLTLEAGPGIALTTDPATDKVTVGSALAAGTDFADRAFKTIAVAGQGNVVADSAADTVTFVAGANVAITTDPVTDAITIAASGGGGGGTPGGADKDVQYNNGGTFGGITPGAIGTVLTSAGPGATPTFAAPTGGSGTPGGADKSLQYNNAGTFGGITPGAAGTVLTSAGPSATPTFAAAPTGAAGALVLLAEVAAVASPSIDFLTRNVGAFSGAIFQGDFDEYQFEYVNVLPATNNVSWWAEFTPDGGASWIVTGYKYVRSYFGSTSDGGSAGNNGSANMLLMDGITNVLGWGGVSGRFAVTNPLSSTFAKQGWGDSVTRNNNAFWYKQSVGGFLESNTPMNGLRFKFNTGNATQGVMRCYGVAKSSSPAGSGPNVLSSGGWDLLNVTVALNSANVDLKTRNIGAWTGGLFQADYDDYRIVFTDLVTSSGTAVSLNLTASIDGGTSFLAGTNYQYATITTAADSAGVSGGTVHSAADALIPLAKGNTAENFWVSGTGKMLRGEMQFSNPNSALYKQMRADMSMPQGTNILVTTSVIGTIQTASAINVLRYTPSAGTIVSGVFKVYGLNKTGGGSSGNLSAPRGLGFVIGDGLAVITTGVKGFWTVPFNGIITGVTLLSSDPLALTGSIVLDIWKVPYASYPPSVANTIVASAKPTISSNNKAQDTTLTGWSKMVTAGDVIGIRVDSITSLTRVNLTLSVTT